MNMLGFDSGIDDYITLLAEENSNELVLNNHIAETHVDLNLNGRNYRYSTPNAILLAQSKGMDLIKCKDKFYIDIPEIFMQNKVCQLKIAYCQSIFNLKNKLYYGGRNNTNYRYDSNLTGLKKELFSKLTFDGERLGELDIASAQFAIAAYVNPAIDKDFIRYVHRNSLLIYW